MVWKKINEEIHNDYKIITSLSETDKQKYPLVVENLEKVFNFFILRSMLLTMEEKNWL